MKKQPFIFLALLIFLTIGALHSVKAGWEVVAATTDPRNSQEDSQYSLTVTTVGAGSFTQEPQDNVIDFGTVITLTAVADTGWSFADWSGDVITTTNPVTFTMDADKTITATFTLNNYSITVSASPPEGGSVAGGGQYDHGQMVVITATTSSGYSFINWTEDGTAVSFNTIYSFLAADDRILEANFSVDYGLLLTPNNAGSGNPGQTVTYAHTLTNTSPILDVFDIMVAGGSFDASLISTTPVTLTAGTGTTLSLTVTIPPGTPAGTEEITTVTATSRADGSATATVTNTTTVNAVYALLLEPDNSSSDNPGQTVVYTHTLTNLSNIADTFDLTSDSSPGFTAVLTPTSPLTLPAGASTTLTLTVTIPETAPAWTVASSSVTAVSQANERVSSVVVNTTTVNSVYGLLLTPDNLGSGDPGQTIIYTHTLSNLGNISDTFDIVLDNGSFEAELISPTPITVPAGASATISLTVAIPAGTAAGVMDVTNITATSQTALDLTDTAVNTTTVSAFYAVQLIPNNVENGNPGQSLFYNHTLTNLGNLVDTYDLSAGSSAGFEVEFHQTPTTITLQPGGSANVRVRVRVANEATAGMIDITSVTATSRGDTNVSSTATNTTTVNAVYALLLTPNNTRSGNPGQTLVYTHTLTNLANITDTVSLSVSSSAGFDSNLISETPVTLPSGASATLALTVAIPPDAAGDLIDVSSITAVSHGNSNVTGVVTNTTTVNPVYALVLVPDNAASGDPGQTVVYTHTLTNQANTSDTFALSSHSSAGFATTLIPASPLSLPAGASTTLTLTVTILADTPANVVDGTSVTATSQSNSNISGTVTNTTTVNAVYALLLEPDNSGSGNPGQTVVYTHTLTNQANITDTFHLTAGSSANFALTLSPSVPVTLAPGASAAITLTLTIATDAAGNLVDTTSVTATSQGGDFSDTVTNTTTVNPVLALLLTPDNVRSGNPGEVLVYSHNLTNQSNITDSYALTATSSAGFGVVLSPATPITLTAGASISVTLTVAIPPGTLAGTVDTTSLTAVSQTDGSVTGTVTNTTTVNTVFGLLLEPDKSGSGDPGQTVVYTHTLTNQTNITDTFNIVASSSLGFGTGLAPLPPITVGAGASTTLTLSVTIPAGTLAGSTDTTSVTATSQTDTSVTGTAVNVTTVNTVYGLLLTPDNQSAGNPGQTLLYSHTLTNQGNTADTFDITTNSSAGFAVTLVTETPVTLLPGTSATIVLTVGIPEDAAAGTEDITSVTATSHGVGNVSNTVANTTSVNPIYALALAPNNSQSGVSGHTLVYTHTLTNLGNSTDTFAITTSNIAGFDVALISPTPVTLTAGASTTVELTVTIPPTTPGGTNDITTVTATSQGNTNVSGTAVNVTTAISPTYNPVLGPDNSGTGFPGQTVVYTHTVTNQGNTSDTFVITANSSAGFGLELAPATPISLPIGHSATITLAVTIPPGTPASVVDTTTVTATSQGNISITDTATNTTSINAVPQPGLVYLPMVQNNYISYFEGPWEVEPNNSSAQANGPLRSGRDYFGYPNDAYDFFSVYLTQPGQLNVTLTNHSGQGAQLQLFYQSTANRVGFVPSPPYTLSYNGQAGWYYIFIFTESGFNSTTPYTLRVTYP
jgi:uncharacterized membrane protein